MLECWDNSVSVPLVLVLKFSCTLLPKIEQWRSRGRGGDSREQARFELFTSQSLKTLMSDRAVARYSNEDWKCSQDELWMFPTGFSNLFSFMNDHSCFLMKEEGGSNNSQMYWVPLLEGCYSFLCNGPLDSFSYVSLCSMPVFASIIANMYVTTVWWLLIYQDSLIHVDLNFSWGTVSSMANGVYSSLQF